VPPPRRSRSAAPRLPQVPLPALGLAEAVPAAAVLAVPTRPGQDGPQIVGTTPVDVAGLLEREKAKGEAGELVAVPVPGEGPLERVLLVGAGAATPADLRKAGAAVARRAKASASLALDVRGLEVGEAELRGLVDGLLLASYGYSRKADPTPRALQDVTVVVTDPAVLQPAADRAVATARATAVARDLVNTPSLDKTPEWLAHRASELLDGLEVQVVDDKQLAARVFGGILGVGQGSSRPPRLVEAVYDGGGSTTVVLVGKGITFDSGGLSLKPNDSMVAMKTDMGGAAAVLGTLRAVADLQLPIKVVGLVAAAENMPSGAAQRPGDVLRQYGGRTVEVLNTDAEGRLVLADAIAYADRELEPDVIVDVATLTGAMPVALGRRHAGLFASDDALAAQLEQASADSGERLWRMPLVEDYRVALDSAIADLRNIGNPKRKLQGGSIIAALFLREFTGGRAWAHLDIAGPARSEGDDDEISKGGTGYGVRLLTRWLEALSARPAPRRGRTAKRSA
jgi:leucyl aminopeptidase